jgi:hypothetical protein
MYQITHIGVADWPLKYGSASETVQVTFGGTVAENGSPLYLLNHHFHTI